MQTLLEIMVDVVSWAKVESSQQKCSLLTISARDYCASHLMPLAAKYASQLLYYALPVIIIHIRFINDVIAMIYLRFIANRIVIVGGCEKFFANEWQKLKIKSKNVSAMHSCDSF